MTCSNFNKISDLYDEGKYDEARSRAKRIIVDPDSTIETKFWAETQLEGIDWSETVRSGKPQEELAKVTVKHAQALRKLTKSGPRYLKFYSLIATHAAELEVLVHEHVSVFMALHQHLENAGHPMMALSVYARRAALTQLIVAKYNRCLRLARFASNYPDRWMLGRAILRIVKAIAPFLITLSRRVL